MFGCRNALVDVLQNGVAAQVHCKKNAGQMAYGAIGSLLEVRGSAL